MSSYHDSTLPTLDALLSPKRNAKATRSKRSPQVLAARANADDEADARHPVTGLLTPPHSQNEEQNHTSMLLSPPPEDVFRSGSRSPVSILIYLASVCCAFAVKPIGYASCHYVTTIGVPEFPRRSSGASCGWALGPSSRLFHS